MSEYYSTSRKRSHEEISSAAQLIDQIEDSIRRIETAGATSKAKKYKTGGSGGPGGGGGGGGSQSGSNKELASLFKEGYMLFLDLKEANRGVHELTFAAAEETKRKREKLNTLNLELQNLQYEKNHYLREIFNCKSFPSVTDSIGLISQEEFFATAPKESLPQFYYNDPHLVMLKRLEYELKQRTELQETLKELKTRLKLLLDDNAKRENFLAGLPAKLQDFVEVAKPIQQYINLTVSNQKIQKNTATFLPNSLYTLYMNLFVYIEGSGVDSVTLEIQGDPKAAGEVPYRVAKKEKEKETQDVYEVHPLSLFVVINCDGVKISLRFNYLKVLQIVTLQTTCSHLKEEHEDILVGLYPDDTGDDTPNLSNYYTITDKNFRFSPKVKGRPFDWVQKLCGLEFLPRTLPQAAVGGGRSGGVGGGSGGVSSPLTSSGSLRKIYNIADVIKDIQRRVADVQALENQLDNLANRIIPSEVKSIQVSVSIVLSSWEETTADSYYRRKRTTKSHRRSSRHNTTTTSTTTTTTTTPNTTATTTTNNNSSNATTNTANREEGEVEEGEVDISENIHLNDHHQLMIENSNEEDSMQPDHSRYFQAKFHDTEKEYYYKARILISPYYPHVAPIFKLSMKSPKTSKTTTISTHPFAPYITAVKTDDETGNLTKSHSSREEVNLKHIQTELNTNYRSFLPPSSASGDSTYSNHNQILSYQMGRLKTCLEIFSDVHKKGYDSSIAKVHGRPWRGRDHRVPLMEKKFQKE